MNQAFYYAEAIEWAYRNQIVDGYGPESFGPDDVVTRQQMCKIVAGFLVWNGTPLHKGKSCEGQFGDYDQLAPWALESVEAMVTAGLIQGDGVNLNPNNGTNRAQFCVVLTRLVDYIENYVSEEPPHDHQWVMNLAQNESTNWASVTISEGESFELNIECTLCDEVAPVEWTADPDGVVLVEDGVVTGLLGGNSVLLQTVWEDMDYECLVYVRDEEELPTEPTEPDPSEPTEPEPSEPTEPEPSEPEEPEHVHDWKLNKSLPGSRTQGDVSINVGESFTLCILCTHRDCTENAPITWTPSKAGVVQINGMRITGAKAGNNTTLSAEWEGMKYSCIIRVRKQTNSVDMLDPEMAE